MSKSRGIRKRTTDAVKAEIVAASISGISPEQIYKLGIASRSTVYRVLTPLQLVKPAPKPRPCVPPGMSYCGTCKRTLDTSHFGSRDGSHRRVCKECERSSENRIRAINPERTKAKNRKDKLKFKYGLTPLEYEERKKSQNYKCAICDSESKLVMDHDHKTNRLRGMLCSNCNILIGKAKDDPNLIEVGASYREMWESKYRDGFVPPDIPHPVKSRRIHTRGKRYRVATVDGKKVCCSCDTAKEPNEFGKRSMCLECDRQMSKLRYDRNPESERRRDLRKYGVSLEYYEQLLNEQGGKCAICKGVNRDGRQLFVDHIHGTGKSSPRGLLCIECNWFIDRVESTNALRRAASYLRQYSESQIDSK